MNLVMGSPQGFISEAGSVAFFEMPPNKINFHPPMSFHIVE